VHFVDSESYFGDFVSMPTAVWTSGYGVTNYTMDWDGQVAETDHGGTIDGMGRCTATLRDYTQIGGDWFLAQTNVTFLADNDPTPTITSVQLQRLSGFSSSAVQSQVTTFDVDSNATVDTTFVDRANNIVTEVTQTAQSSLPATNVTVNGLLVRESTATVPTPILHVYDALGRQTATTSPLGFTSYKTYNQSGQLASQTDFTGLATTYKYYPNGVAGAGQLQCQSKNGKNTYCSYTARGELWQT